MALDRRIQVLEELAKIQTEITSLRESMERYELFQEEDEVGQNLNNLEKRLVYCLELML